VRDLVDELLHAQVRRRLFGAGEPPRLGRLVLEDRLGAGAMGTVFAAYDPRLERKVAVKVLETADARVLAEARALAKLSHPNVVAVHDADEVDGTAYIVMELVTGTSLRAWVTEPRPWRSVVRVMKQAADGVAAAHAAGLVHRDLKPANVIVEAGDIPRIVDFGIAVLQEYETEGSERLTASGMIVGTPLYMAPEQAKGEPLDQRADLYSLGVILYELLANKAPFEGTAMEVALAKINHDVPAIAGADPLLDRFMRKLAARSRDDRFASAHDALAVLELVDRDPAAAASELGIMDVAKALATISLP
jgi:serine/threonine protein kinase